MACLFLLISPDAYATFTQDRHQAHGPAGACGSYENGWPRVVTLHNLPGNFSVNGMTDRYGQVVGGQPDVTSADSVRQLTNQNYPFYWADGNNDDNSDNNGYVAFNPYGSPSVICPSPQRSGGNAYKDYHQDRVHEMYGQEVSYPGDNGSTFFDPRITIGLRACVGLPVYYPDVPSNLGSALECLIRFPPPHMYPVVIPGAWITGSNLMWPLHSCWKWACGGGMVNSSSSLTINECTFVGNFVRFCARLAEPGVKNVNDYKGNAHAENYNSLANRTAIDPDYRGPGRGNRFAGPLVKAGGALVDTKVAVEINSPKGSEPKYLVLVNGVVTEGATATVQGKFGVEKTVTADPVASLKYKPGGEAYYGAERAEIELKNTHQKRLSSGGSQEVHDELILYKGRVVNPRTQLCAYEDPGDGMDMAGGDQPSHHNRPNPKKTSLQNMGESLVGMAQKGGVTGQALPKNDFFNDLSGVLFKPSQKIIGSALGIFTLIDAITSKLNHVVMQDEGCVDLPIGPYPPIPTKTISTPGYFPTLQPICQFGENPNGLKKSSADPSQYVVDSKNISNICACPGNAMNPDGFCTETDPLKYNTFEVPKVLVGFNNVIPYCLEGQKSKEDELCACNPGVSSTDEAPCVKQEAGDRIAYRLGVIGTGAKVDVPLSFCRAEMLATTGDQCACTATRTTDCQPQNQNMSYCRSAQVSTETMPCSTTPTPPICQAGAAPQKACISQTGICNPKPNCASCDQTMIDANVANNGTGAGSPGCDAKCGTCIPTCSAAGESDCTEICSITGPSTTCRDYCAAGTTPAAPTCTPICGETADPNDGSLCIRSEALALPDTNPRTVKACTPADTPTAANPCACRPAPDPQVPGCTPLTSGPPLAACVDAAPAQVSTPDAPCSCTPGRTTGCQVPAAGEQFAYRIKDGINVMGHKAIGIIKGNGGANFKEASYSFNFIAPNKSAPATPAVVINGLKDIPTTTPGSPPPLAPKPDKQYFITMDDPTKVCLYEKAKKTDGTDAAKDYCSARPDSMYDSPTKCAAPDRLNPIVSSCVPRVATPPLQVTTLPDCTTVSSFQNTQPDPSCSSHYYPLMQIALGEPAHTAVVGAKDNNKCARLHGIEFCTGVTGDTLKYTPSLDPNVKPRYAGGLQMGKFEPSSPEKDGYLRGAKRMCVGRLGKMLVKPIITKIVTTVRPRNKPEDLKQFTVVETRKSLDAYDLEKATGQTQSAISIKSVTTTEISAEKLADPALKADDLIYLNVKSTLTYTESYPTTLPVTGETTNGDTTVKVEIIPADSNPSNPVLEAIVTTTTKTVDGNKVSETITKMEKKDKDNVTQNSRMHVPFPTEMPISEEINSYEPDLRAEALPGSILMASYMEGDKIIYAGRIPKYNEEVAPATPFPDDVINQDREIVADESAPPLLVHPETSNIKKCIGVPDPQCPVSYSRMTVADGETVRFKWPETKVGETVAYSGGIQSDAGGDDDGGVAWSYANNKCSPDGTWEGAHTDAYNINVDNDGHHGGCFSDGPATTDKEIYCRDIQSQDSAWCDIAAENVEDNTGCIPNGAPPR